MNVDHLIQHDGYWALFSLIALEGLGIPVPGEAILIAAGTYAGATHHLSVAGIFAVAALAAFVGQMVGYVIGVKGGYALLRRYGKYIRLRDAHIKVGRYIFDRYGGAVVFFGRFVAILRTYAAFLAGTNRMAVRRFVLFNAAGALAWSLVWTIASYSLGSKLGHATGDLNWILGGVAVIAVVVVVLTIRHQSRKLEARAEAAYPGPLED